ncbi:MAG: ribosome maturation factor RimM [Spirochaetaceae bacterium]
MPQRQKRESESFSRSSTKAGSRDILAVGRVGRSHGTRGEFVLRSLSGETGHLLRLKELTLRDPEGSVRPGALEATYEIETLRKAHERVLVKLRGFDTPEAVGPLRGMEAWVDRKYAAPLGKEEYYVADLVGCRVFRPTTAGGSEEIGQVAGVIEGPADDFLEILLEEGRAVLVPFRAEYVGTVDIKKRRVEVIGGEILE